MDRRLRRPVGALALSCALLVTGCGGDDDGGGGDQADVCARASELDAAREAIPTAQPSSQEEIDEAKTQILAMIDALQALLDAVPADLEDDADTVRETTDEIEERIEAAEGADLFLEVPTLLAQIAGGDAGPLSRILAYVDETCS